MNNYEDLIKRYPYLFAKDEMEPIVLFGIECGLGWYSILDQAFRCITSRYLSSLRILEEYKHMLSFKQKDNPTNANYDDLRVLQEIENRIKEEQEKLPVFEQIKSKFAELRIYGSNITPYVQGVLDMAEEMSRVTCEKCGERGNVYSNGWITVLCDEHAKEKHGEHYEKKMLTEDNVVVKLVRD
jgi:hypothetical protein